MNWRRIAFNKTIRNARQYFGYLSSSSLAVMVFFMFALFVNNPHVENGYMTNLALQLLAACRVIVVLFAVFFILYFHSSLLRMRQREFGLLMTLGMTPRQVGRMIFGESLGIGVAAVAVGIGLGLIFGKMFMLAMGNILSLDEPIPFVVPEQTILSTVIIFGLLFLVEGFWVSRRMVKLTPKTLIGAARARQQAPKFSFFLMLVALACLSGGYYLAVFKSEQIGVYMAAVLLLTGIGTYFLFTQLMGFVLGMMRKRPLEGTTLLIVSRLQHRMKDYARILAVVTLLIAAVLSGMGSVFGIQQAGELNAIRVNPFSVQVFAREATASNVTPEIVRDAFQKNDVRIEKETKTPLLLGQISGDGKKYGVWVLSNSSFNELADMITDSHSRLEQYMNKPSAPSAGEARFLVPYPLVLQDLFPSNQVQLNVNDQQLDLKLDGQHDARVLNSNSGRDFVMVLPDDQFETVLGHVPAESRWTAFGYMTPEWPNSKEAVTSVKTPVMPLLDEGQLYVTNTVLPYSEAMQLLGVMLFAGFFISVLFFLASGSAIYFKLFAQQEDDIRQFKALRRMGFRSVEVKKILTVEFLLLFFAPFAVGLVHSTMAMINFRNLVTLDGIWLAFATVVIVSFVSFLLYFVVARFNYIRRVWQQAQA